MKKTLILAVMLLNYLFAFSQNKIEAVVFDPVKNQPVQYAKVRIQNNNSGVLTNSEGSFRIDHSEKDSLVITHIFYPKKIINPNDFASNDTIFLYQKVQEIVEVTVTGDKEKLYNLIIACKKNLSKMDKSESRAFLSLESYSDQVPLEMIQAYYNAEINSNGINDLKLKTGRIGLSPQDNQYFVSLGTTNVLLRSKLLYSKKNKLPLSPLQVSKRKLKKLYRIKFVSMENGLHKYNLVPKKIKEQLFEAFLYIDKVKERIHRIEYIVDDLIQSPFVPINQTDSIDSINIKIAYNYEYNDTKGKLDNIEMKYNFLYQNQVAERKINSHCLLLLYDDKSLFKIPLGTFNSNSSSDYEKITYQPFNRLFWENNEVICPDKQAVENERFFQKNGVLLNFDSLEHNNEKLKSKIIFWDRKRIFLDQINGEFNYNVSANTLLDYHNLTTLSDHYNLVANIYLDQNEFNDSTHYDLKTIINLDESFYHLKKNNSTLCFINLYFDIIEVHKRKLEHKLSQHKWSEKQVDSIYFDVQEKLNNYLKEFIKDVDYGKNPLQLKDYIDFVLSELSIDNSLLLEDKKLQNGLLKEVKHNLAIRYNYGSALIKNGKFNEALQVLKETEKMGDEHPWLFYNIGVCYLKLEQKNLACKYFLKSEEFGGELESSVKDELCLEN